MSAVRCTVLLAAATGADPDALAPLGERVRARLAWARHAAAPAVGPRARLWRWFGYPELAAHALPAGPFAALGDGLDPGERWWLCAAPVHLRADLRTVLLLDACRFELDADAADALLAALNAGLQLDGASLRRGAGPGRWYLASDVPEPAATTPLADAAGRELRALLPQGAHGARLRRLMTEAQMLLHEHPLNRAREAAGELPINGLWLWGGGSLPAPPAPRPPFDCVLSEDPFARGLALHAGLRAAPLPEPRQLAGQLAGCRALLLAAGDGGPPDGRFAACCEQLLRAVDAGEIPGLEIVGTRLTYRLQRHDRWRFWRALRARGAHAR